MTSLRIRFNLLTDDETTAAFAGIRDPMPPAFKSLEPRHRRAIANAIEAAILRKLNGGAVPSLHTHVKHPGSLYRPVVESRMEDTGAFMVTYRDQQTGKIWTRPEGTFFDGRYRPLLNPDPNNPGATVPMHYDELPGGMRSMRDYDDEPGI